MIADFSYTTAEVPSNNINVPRWNREEATELGSEHEPFFSPRITLSACSAEPLVRIWLERKIQIPTPLPWNPYHRTMMPLAMSGYQTPTCFPWRRWCGSSHRRQCMVFALETLRTHAKPHGPANGPREAVMITHRAGAPSSLDPYCHQAKQTWNNGLCKPWWFSRLWRLFFFPREGGDSFKNGPS